MSQFDRMARATVVAAAMTIGVQLPTVAVSAQSAAPSAKATAAAAAKAKAADAAQDPAAQKKQAGDQARASLESGLKSHSAGKHQLAADQLSSALRGGLASTDMARALYVRGLSYKALSKPGLAISDLTSALWLKNGLSESDRQSAMAERSEAYRLAGLSDAGLGAERAVVSNPNPSAAVASAPTTTPAPAIAPAPAASAASVPAPSAVPVPPATASSTWSSTTGTVTRQAPDSEAAQDAARARRLAATPVETNGIDAAVLGRSVNAPAPVSAEVRPTLAPPSIAAGASAPAADAPTLSALPSEGSSPPAATNDALASVPSTVSGFFSNLFGGGGQASATTTAPAPVAVAAAAPPFTTSSTGALAQPSAARAAPPIIPVAPAPKQAAKGGKYKLHIAAVRSRAEAEALAQQLSSKHGGDLAQRAPTVDEAVIGSMGTFYRVRVGSYANPDEPRGVCNKLRTSGFDCLVVTN